MSELILQQLAINNNTENSKVSRGYGRLFAAVPKFLNAVKAIDDGPTHIYNLQSFLEAQLDSLLIDLNAVTVDFKRRPRPGPSGQQSSYFRHFQKKGDKNGRDRENMVKYVQQYPMESQVQFIDATDRRITALERDVHAVNQDNDDTDDGYNTDSDGSSVNSIKPVGKGALSGFCEGSS